MFRLFILCFHSILAQSLVTSWLPSHIGDRWFYQIESLEGTTGGFADPTVERWQTVNTVVSSVDLPEGTLFLKRLTPLDPKPPDAKSSESHYLFRGDTAGQIWNVTALNNAIQTFRLSSYVGSIQTEDICFKKG